MSSTIRTRIWSAMVLVRGDGVGSAGLWTGAGRLRGRSRPTGLLLVQEVRRKDAVLVDERLEDHAIGLVVRWHDADGVPIRVQDRVPLRVHLDVILWRAKHSPKDYIQVDAK